MIKARNFNTVDHKARILVAPLDWGLGHATRCIPIISILLQQNCTVIVAAGGLQKTLLQKEFPDLQFIKIKGYQVRYSRYKLWMPAKLFLQLPKIIYRIYAENRWLKKIVHELHIDAVISDNRMGLYHKKKPCVYITHQLTIKTGNTFTENIAQKIHYHFINKFKACWIPDYGGEFNLAGVLSHPATLPKTPVTYLGPLSRLEKIESEKKYDLCIILSGPEPQRAVFEKIILKGLPHLEGKVYLVRGLPGETGIPEIENLSLEIKNHLPAYELSNIIQQSKMVIARCGYSTIMDLVKLQKKAILVPTPGQTEQEYLGGYLHQQKFFYCIDQGAFSLPGVIKKTNACDLAAWPVWEDAYITVLENFVTGLKIDSADI